MTENKDKPVKSRKQIYIKNETINQLFELDFRSKINNETPLNQSNFVDLAVNLLYNELKPVFNNKNEFNKKINELIIKSEVDV